MLVAQFLQVRADSFILVLGASPKIGEPARGEVDGFLGACAGCGADGGDPGAGGGELGREVGCVLAVVCLAGGADAGVAGGEEDGDAAAAELGVEVADAAGVFFGDGLWLC